MLSSHAETTIENFDANPDGRIESNVVFTDVYVSPHDLDEVRVRLVREVARQFQNDANRILKEHEISISEEDGVVRILARYSRETMVRWSEAYGRTPLSSELYVQIPSHYPIEVTTVSGNIETGSVGGAVYAKSVSGNVVIEDVGTHGEITTVSGKINIGSAQENLDVHSTSGKVTLGDVGGSVSYFNTSGKLSAQKILGNLDAKTTSGRVEVEHLEGHLRGKSVSGSVQVNQANSNVEIASTSGSIALGLPSDSGYNFALRSRSGRITSDFEVDGTKERHSIHGTVNGGGKPVSLQSISGKLIVSEILP